MSHLTAFTAHLRKVNNHNLTTFRRQPLLEISGSLGDLGTFLPLLIALASSKTSPHQISLSTTLILTGIYNIATGILFGIPLPVQPMKAITAIAISNNLSRGEVMAAGIFVAGCVAFLSITGLLELTNRYVPIPVVKGIQVGAGLSLVVPAGQTALAKLSWTGFDSRLMLVVVFLLLLTSSQIKRMPFAFIITVAGVIYSATQSGSGPKVYSGQPTITVPTWAEWRRGIFDAGLGQLPLTTLNSVIAVVALAGDLLPDVSTPSATTIGLSVAAMNLIGCWFGCIPACHGSGGLAAQYRFGARSGASIIFLGLLKLLLGLTFANSLIDLLDRFPVSFLTIMVIAAGTELAMAGRDLNDPERARDLKAEKRSPKDVSYEEVKERHSIMMYTAAMLLAFKNDGIGFLAGMQWHYFQKVTAYFEKHRTSSTTDEQQPLLAEP